MLISDGISVVLQDQEIVDSITSTRLVDHALLYSCQNNPSASPGPPICIVLYRIYYRSLVRWEGPVIELDVSESLLGEDSGLEELLYTVDRQVASDAGGELRLPGVEVNGSQEQHFSASGPRG